MGPEAVRLMRAIKERCPDVKAGAVVDPFIAAAGVELNPTDPGYRVAMRELLEAGVLKPRPDLDHQAASIMGANPQYEVTPEGVRRIASV